MIKGEDQKKELKYEDLVKAMGEGEFGMTKFIWSVCQRVDRIAEQVPMDLEKFQEKFDQFIAEYQEPQDGKDGKDGQPGPRGPQGKEGPEGKPGKEGPAGNDGADGFPGARGEKGPEGRMGRMPAHEWDGTKIRFQIPLGWGPWVDLRGPVGPTGHSFGPGESMGGAGALEWIKGSGNFVAQGVAGIRFGANLTVTKEGNGVLVEATGGADAGDFIRKDGTTTETARIPFTLGIRIPALQTIDFGDSGSEVFRIYTDGIDAILEPIPTSLIGSNVLITAGQNVDDQAGGSVYLYGAAGTGELPLTNGGVWTGSAPTGRPQGTLGNTNIGDLGVDGYLVAAQYAEFRGNIFVGTNSGIAVGVANIALGGNTAKSIGVERAQGLVSAGQALSINAGGAKASTTNQNGGNLTLSAGATTGTGVASVIIQATGGGSSGSSTRNPQTVATFTALAMTFADAVNVVVNSTTGTKIGTATTQKIGFWNATPVVRPAAYTPTNVTADRAYDANATTLDELADVVGTLIADLQSVGLIG